MLQGVCDHKDELDREIQGAAFNDDVHCLASRRVWLQRVASGFVGHIPYTTDDQGCDHNICTEREDETSQAHWNDLACDS